MEEVIFSEVIAKVAIDFVTVVAATIDQHENVFVDIELKSGAKCMQDSDAGAWTLHGDLDSINRAYNLMSTIYNLSQSDVMSNEAHIVAPGTPSFNNSSEYSEVVRFAANTPVVPSLMDDADEPRSSDETSVTGAASCYDSVGGINKNADHDDAFGCVTISVDESNCNSTDNNAEIQGDDFCKSRRKSGLPRKALMNRVLKKVTLLLGPKDLGSEKRTLRPRSVKENAEEKGPVPKEDQKPFKPRGSKKSRDLGKKRHIEAVIKKISRSKKRTCFNQSVLYFNKNALRASGRKAECLTSAPGIPSHYKGDAFNKQPNSSAVQSCICRWCNKSFSSVSNLYRHQKVSHSGVRYPCTNCDKKFTCLVSLQRHRRAVHEGLRCDDCQEILASVLAKLHHVCSDKRKKSEKCYVCGSTFSCKSNLNKHIRARHSGGDLSCGRCSSTFDTALDLATHLQSTHSTCCVCEKQIETVDGEHGGTCDCTTSAPAGNSNLDTTEKTTKEASGQKSRQPIKCTHCDKVFSSSSNARKHERIVHKNDRFNCHLCARVYACKEQLSHHIVKVHQGLTYRCELCQEEFKNRLRLAKHQKLIHNHLVIESSYQCEQCGKTFLYKNNLQRHRKHDHEGLSYDCGTCGLAFKSLQQAKEHDMITHQGKTIECGLCHKTFSSHCKLKEHETSVHTAHRPHQCAVCGEQFGRHSALSYHLQKKHERRVNVAGHLVPLPKPCGPLFGQTEANTEGPPMTLTTEGIPIMSSANIKPDSKPTRLDFLERGIQASSHMSPTVLDGHLVCDSVPTNAIPSGSAATPEISDRLPEPTTASNSSTDAGHHVSVQQLCSSTSNQGPSQLRLAVTEMVLFPSATDVDSNQNPLLALPDGLTLYDSFFYSPLHQHH